MFDHRTKTNTGWVPSIDVVSNGDEIKKMEFDMVITNLEDLFQIKQEPESLKSWNTEENVHPYSTISSVNQQLLEENEYLSQNL